MNVARGDNFGYHAECTSTVDILVAVTWTAETENLNPKTPSPIFHVVMKNLQILCNYVNP